MAINGVTIYDILLENDPEFFTQTDHGQLKILANRKDVFGRLEKHFFPLAELGPKQRQWAIDNLYKDQFIQAAIRRLRYDHFFPRRNPGLLYFH